VSSTRFFCDVSLRDIRDQRAGGDLELDEVLAHVEHSARQAEGLRIWRAFDASELAVRSAMPFVPSPYTAHPVTELWDMPFGAKDVFNSARFGTEKGSSRWIGYRAGNDARVIDHAARSGCVLVGMTATSEFAVDKESPTLNPHDPLRTPGTSSAGSAVACALGIVPFALGSQSGASIVRPASYCGTIGMKPSFGLLPRTGALKTSDSLDTVGFFAGRVDSLRPVLSALRVSGRDYPLVSEHVDPNRDVETDVATLRVGVVRTQQDDDCDLEVKTLFDSLLRAIAAAVADVREVDVRSALAGAHDVHDDIYNASLAYHLSEDFDANPDDFSPVLHDRMEAGRSVSRERYVRALSEQERYASVVGDALSTFDVAVSLATCTTAPVRGERPVPDPSLMWTMVGVPAVCLPLGFTRQGLPVGVQFIARKYRDYQLLAGIEALARAGVVHDRSLPVKGIEASSDDR
jgi:Asp-tRNA(Asn)/Glu-tRNA(Gln) amidotransferase A subunit family amidase